MPAIKCKKSMENGDGFVKLKVPHFSRHFFGLLENTCCSVWKLFCHYFEEKIKPSSCATENGQKYMTTARKKLKQHSDKSCYDTNSTLLFSVVCFIWGLKKLIFCPIPRVAVKPIIAELTFRGRLESKILAISHDNQTPTPQNPPSLTIL